MSERKVVLYISMSIDGFLATKDDGLDWLSIVQAEGADYNYTAITERVDTYIVGRVTYDTVMKLTGGEFPQATKYNCFVVTRQDRAPENGVTFYNGDLEKLISKLKAEPGKDIYCDGGGQVVQMLMEKNLIDEYIISVIPIFLGDGKRLFLGGVKQLDVTPHESTYYPETGLVQLRYTKV